MKKVLIAIFLIIATQTVSGQEVEYYNNELMQQLIDLPELQEYFEAYKDKKHFLTILDNGAIDTEKPLVKSGKPVNFMTRQELGTAKVYHQLEINEIDIDESAATIICLFPIEKLQINVYFIKENKKQWKIDSSRLYQL